MLLDHFSKSGAAPVMMGGDVDAMSKGVFGIDTKADSLLIVDPHYRGKLKPDWKTLQSQGYLIWKPFSDFVDSSFYNLCIPKPELA